MVVPIDLSDQAAVITGGGEGIGRAICLEPARAGADVFALSRTPEELAALGEKVRALGRRYASRAAALPDPAVPEQLAGRAEAALKRVRVLVNNAGLAANAPAEEVGLAQWDLTLDVNLRAAFFCAQASADECWRAAVVGSSTGTRNRHRTTRAERS